MILVTHIDLDGIGAEIVVRHFFPAMGKEKIHHCSYHNVDTVVANLLATTEENLIITDISVTKELASHISEKYPGRVELYDHHKTAQDALHGHSWVHVDLTRSGTKIIFDTLARDSTEEIPPGLKTLVFHVNDYDLWIHESPDSSGLNGMLYLLGRGTFADLMLDRISRSEPLISSADRYYLKGMDQQKLKYFSERVKTAIVAENRLVVVATHYLSELSQYIRNQASPKWEKVDYIDILDFEHGAHALRSYNPDFDVSEVASRNGGGGHRHAAGYPMKLVPPGLWFTQF